MTHALRNDTNVVANQKADTRPRTRMKPNFYDRRIPSHTVSAVGMTHGPSGPLAKGPISTVALTVEFGI